MLWEGEEFGDEEMSDTRQLVMRPREPGSYVSQRRDFDQAFLADPERGFTEYLRAIEGIEETEPTNPDQESLALTIFVVVAITVVAAPILAVGGYLLVMLLVGGFRVLFGMPLLVPGPSWKERRSRPASGNAPRKSGKGRNSPPGKADQEAGR